MSAQLTPGVWRVREWTRHAATTVVVDDPSIVTGIRVIADCESEDDARLFAASRELLQALQGVLRVADRKTDEFDAARAAIAKATGSAT